MTLYYFSDSFLGGFSIIAALISIITLSLDTSKKLSLLIFEHEKNTHTPQGYKELPLKIEKIKKYTENSSKRIKLSFILVAICVAIYLILTLFKSIYPIIQAAAYVTIEICPFSVLFSYHANSAITTITANWICIVVFIFSWVQFFLIIVIYIHTFIMLYKQLDIANS